MNSIESFRSRIAEGGVCVGTCITFCDPAVSELIAEAGYDFTWIDMEHGPIDIHSALRHVMAVRGTDTAPFIRVPWNDLNVIKPILDLAPAAVIVPQIRTADFQSPADAPIEPARLTAYLVAHGDYAGGLSRPVVSSHVVNGTPDFIQASARGHD